MFEHGYRVLPPLLADEVVHLILYLRRPLASEIHGEGDIILGEESPERVLVSTPSGKTQEILGYLLTLVHRGSDFHAGTNYI